MSDTEHKIRECAYHLWNNAGRPDGQCDAFWLTAQRNVLANSMDALAIAKTTKAAKPSKAKAKTARKKAA